jgi:hypothetical protein
LNWYTAWYRLAWFLIIDIQNMYIIGNVGGGDLGSARESYFTTVIKCEYGI